MSAIGEVVFTRRYWKCTCGTDGSYAADALLGVEGQRYTKTLQKHCCRLAAQTAFAPTSQLLHELLGADLCPETVRTLVEGHGKQMARFQAEDTVSEQAFRQAAAAVEFTTDAGKVNTRQEGCKDLKIAVISKREDGKSATPDDWKAQRLPAATMVLAFAMIATAKEFRKSWRPRLRRLGVTCLANVHALADGASWIGKAVQRVLTGCVQTLDFFHACQHLSKCCERIFGEGTSAARTAYEHSRGLVVRQGWAGVCGWVGELLGVVYHAAFSPDSRRVVTACDDKTARIWDVSTGQPVTLAAPAPAASIPIGVWDAATGKHWGGVLHAEFSPDGQRVLTASEDKTARVWNVATGQPVTPSLVHQGEVTYAAFSSDGRRVLTTSVDTARIWDAATGQPVTPQLQHQGRVNHAAFSPDGRRVLTCGAKTARVWDAATGQPVTLPLAHRGVVSYVAFSPDGRRVVTASEDKTARVWDTATGQPITPPLVHQDIVLHATFSPDARQVFTASADKTGRVWDLTLDDRPLEDWLTLTQLLGCRRIDTTGALLALTAEEATQAWQKLRPRYPQDFTVTAERAFAWHRREMGDCLRERNYPAAVFHAWHASPEWHFLWVAPLP